MVADYILSLFLLFFKFSETIKFDIVCLIGKTYFSD